MDDTRAISNCKMPHAYELPPTLALTPAMSPSRSLAGACVRAEVPRPAKVRSVRDLLCDGPPSGRPLSPAAVVPVVSLSNGVSSPVSSPSAASVSPVVPLVPVGPEPDISKRRTHRKHYANAKPSAHCHVCARTSKRVRFRACANVARGVCRKVVCEKCFARFGWDWSAAAEDKEWTCTHCRGQCPPGKSQCFIYARVNRRRESVRVRRARADGAGAKPKAVAETRVQPPLPVQAARLSAPVAPLRRQPAYMPLPTQVFAPMPAPAYPGLQHLYAAMHVGPVAVRSGSGSTISSGSHNGW